MTQPNPQQPLSALEYLHRWYELSPTGVWKSQCDGSCATEYDLMQSYGNYLSNFKLRERDAEWKAALQAVDEIANRRWSEWGERAESVAEALDKLLSHGPERKL